MNIKLLKASLAGLILSVSGFANASLINTNFNNFHCLCFQYNGMGQSFTAEDSSVTIGLNVMDLNSHLNPILDMTLTFLEGDGPFGNVLDTFSITSPSGYSSEWRYFDLSHIPLSIDSSYSFFVTSTGGRGGVNRKDDNLYDGGRAFLASGADYGELSFSITPNTSVPEPSTLAIFALGIMSLASRKFKKSN